MCGSPLQERPQQGLAEPRREAHVLLLVIAKMGRGVSKLWELFEQRLEEETDKLLGS